MQEVKKKKIKEKEALIDELMSSHADAAAIVDDYAKKVEQDREEAKIVPITKPVISQIRTFFYYVPLIFSSIFPRPSFQRVSSSDNKPFCRFRNWRRVQSTLIRHLYWCMMVHLFRRLKKLRRKVIFDTFG